MDFSDWIINKYIQWPGDKRGNKNQSIFARWIGVPQSVMSDWMKKGGTVPRKAKYVTLLAKKYPDIYKVLDIPEPDTQFELDGLPQTIRRRIQEATAEVNREMEERGLTGETPEAEALTIRIFEKYGFKYVSTETVPDE
jgi:hypothetical protein